jgi:hypothetical protein
MAILGQLKGEKLVSFREAIWLWTERTNKKCNIEGDLSFFLFIFCSYSFHTLNSDSVSFVFQTNQN